MAIYTILYHTKQVVDKQTTEKSILPSLHFTVNRNKFQHTHTYQEANGPQSLVCAIKKKVKKKGRKKKEYKWRDEKLTFRP